MDQKIYDNYLSILKHELVVALGCTEPIAIAYAGAKVRAILGRMPEHITVFCSGNIVKNVKAVTVPNAGGGKGIAVAATLGVLGGDVAKELAALESVTPADIEECKKLLATGFCSCELIENVANLYIVIQAKAGKESAEVVIKDYHSNITKIMKNGEVLMTRENDDEQNSKDFPNKNLLNVKDILEFADNVKIEDIQEVLDRQIKLNSAIADEGMNNSYGAEVGRTLMAEFDKNNVKLRAKSKSSGGIRCKDEWVPLFRL